MIVLRILGIVCLLVALSIWLVICIAAGVSSGIKTYFDNKLESAGKQKCGRKKLIEGEDNEK